MTIDDWYNATEMLQYYRHMSLFEICQLLPYEVDYYLATFIKHKRDEEPKKQNMHAR